MMSMKPSYAEFRELVKAHLSDDLAGLNDERLEEYLNEKDSIDVIQNEYDHSSLMYDQGMITDHIFRNGSVSAAAYTLYLLY